MTLFTKILILKNPNALKEKCARVPFLQGLTSITVLGIDIIDFEQVKLDEFGYIFVIAAYVVCRRGWYHIAQTKNNNVLFELIKID